MTKYLTPFAADDWERYPGCRGFVINKLDELRPLQTTEPHTASLRTTYADGGRALVLLIHDDGLTIYAEDSAPEDPPICEIPRWGESIAQTVILAEAFAAARVVPAKLLDAIDLAVRAELLMEELGAESFNWSPMQLARDMLARWLGENGL